MPRRVPGEPYARIDVVEAVDMLERGKAVVIDVRTRQEFEEGHVEGAAWIPVAEVTKRLGELPDEGALLFICEVGVRSGLACEYAASLGVDLDRLFNIEDGMVGWREKKMPVARGAEE